MGSFSFETYSNEHTTYTEYTFVYKHASGIDIPLDVYIPTSSYATKVREQRGNSLPIVFWIHGGGGVQGGRTERYQHLLEGVNRTPFVGVFPDYRLCPQVGFEQQLADVADAFKWTVDSLQQELRKQDSIAPTLELNQMIVQGNSMGGFYSLILPLGALPKLHITDPKAHPYLARIRGTIPIYPVVSMDDEFWTVPQIPFGGELPQSLTQVMKQFEDPNGPVITNTHPEGPETLPGFARNAFYPYSQSQASSHRNLFGSNPAEQKRFVEQFNMFTHIKLYSDQIKNVVGSASSDSHPLQFYLVHGDKDAAVPVRQSAEFVQLARALGFEVQYDEHPDQDHLFDAQPDRKFIELYEWIQRLTNIASA